MIMKRKLSAFVVAAAVVLTSLLSGCSLFSGEDEMEFCFSDGAGAMTENLTTVKAPEILNYQSKYSDAVSSYYAERLDEKEKYVYNAVSYAVDNGYVCVYIPEQLFSDVTRLSELVSFYSCDSPFLEHNYADDGTFSVTSVSNSFKGYYTFNLPRNTELFTREKAVAYDHAKEIVKAIPETMVADFDKAAYLYDYVAENVRFDDTNYNFNTVPIYDTIVSSDKQAICDGFADTLILLFNLADIDAFAVEGTSADGEGHVLTVAELDGKYYYFDSSADAGAVKMGFKGRFYFAMSEESAFSRFAPEKQFEQWLPEADVSATEKSADITVNTADDMSAEKAADIITVDGSVLVDFSDSMSEREQKEFAQKVADSLGRTITKAYYNGLAGYAAQ